MFLRCLMTLLFSLSLALPAQALLTLGVAPDSSGQLRSESEAKQLTTQLQGVLNEEVRLRVFRSEVELNEWMQRYRMVDLALLSRGFYNQQPAGSLLMLTQVSASNLAVARPGLPPETLTRLRSVMQALQLNRPRPQIAPPAAPSRARKPVQAGQRPGDGELQPGQEILAAPGEAPRITKQPARPVRQAKPKPQRPVVQAKIAPAEPTPTIQPVETPLKQPAPVTEAPVSPAVVVPQAPPADQPTPTESPVTTPALTSQEPAAPPASTTVEPRPPSTESQPAPTSALPWLAFLILLGGVGYLFQHRRQKSRTSNWPAVNQNLSVPPADPVQRRSLPSRAQVDSDPLPSRPVPMHHVPLPPSRKSVEAPTVSAPEPSQVAISTPPTEELPADSAALPPLTEEAPQERVDNQQSLDLPSLAPADLPSLDRQPTHPELEEQIQPGTMELSSDISTRMDEPEPDDQDTEEKSAFVGSIATKTPNNLPPLRGDIATVNIARLLQAAASQPAPCILHIRGRHDEKRLHFCKGHLSNAVSINRANQAKTGFLMNKVGYLLIRQGRITEVQRDQALELCKQRPKLRIGEALVELGVLSRESLLEALQTQAEGVIFSLFIFPEGRYEIVADDSETPAANDLNINLTTLLSKAETQEPEWERIRQAIPSLDAILDFPEGGRDKLGNARMTEHQQLVLSLIDGQRPIRDICIAATMLDLEVYKFLFFMVNAKILTQASTV